MTCYDQPIRAKSEMSVCNGCEIMKGDTKCSK